MVIIRFYGTFCIQPSASAGSSLQQETQVWYMRFFRKGLRFSGDGVLNNRLSKPQPFVEEDHS